MLKLRRSDEGGQAMVEFALVAPIFFLLMFGIIQLGLLFAGQNGLVSAVRETARYAAPYRVIDAAGATTTCDTVVAKLTEAMSQSVLGYDSTAETPSVTYEWLTDPDGEYYIEVVVQVSYKFPLYVPLVGQFLDGADGSLDGKLKLSAQEEMRVENDPLANFDGPVTCP
jgi:Flp pilus assembly protein TadG